MKFFLHWTFYIFLFLVAWGLAEEQFYDFAANNSPLRWAFGIGTSIFFALCIMLHGIVQMLVANKFYNVGVSAISFWLFGGVSTFKEEFPTPGAEFFIAAAGLATSLVVAATMIGLSYLVASGTRERVPPASKLTEISFLWLGINNAFFSALNMLPIYPLDGGHILRSVFWKVLDDPVRATVISSNVGLFFGTGIAIAGFAILLFYAFLPGLWLLLIGLTINWFATVEQEAAVVVSRLKNIVVADLMTTNVNSVPLDGVTVSQFMEKYLRVHKHSHFPVVDSNNKPVGIVSLHQIRCLLPEAWTYTPIRALMVTLDEACIPLVSPRDLVTDVLKKMANKTNRCFVVDDLGQLVGYLSAADIIFCLSTDDILSSPFFETRRDRAIPILSPSQSIADRLLNEEMTHHDSKAYGAIG